MKSLINGYRIRQINENSCEIVNIVNRTFQNRLPNFVNFDWNQGGHLEKLEKTLFFMNIEDFSLEKERKIEDIEEIIETLMKETTEKDSWISKYQEMLKPSPEDFSNIDKVDILNLYGEAYKPKIMKNRRNFKANNSELPKNMAGKVTNNRTKEYLANLMTKNKN